jgi:cell filamentation protein
VAIYDAEDDPYCYKGTIVLKNRRGLRRQERLSRFEAAAVAQRALEPLPRGKFDARHYRAIHRHLFGDVYRWAGKYRTVRMTKGASPFCFPEYIAEEMQSLFGSLAQARFLAELSVDDFAVQAANFLAELNAIHPFREGNGRTQVSFMALLSVRAGRPLVVERLVPSEFLAAMIESFVGSKQPLADQLRSLVDDE